MTKKIKTSLVLSSLILGTVSLYAVPTGINLSGSQEKELNTPIEINSSSGDSIAVDVCSLSGNSKLVNNSTISNKISSNQNDIYSAGVHFDSHGDSLGMSDNSQLINKKDIIVEQNGNYEVWVDGINISSMKDKAKALNEGSISVYSKGKQDVSVAGIAINSMENNSIAENKGTIKASAEGEQYIYSQGIIVLNADYDWDDNRNPIPMQGTSSIINSGTIEVFGKASEVEVQGIAGALKDNAKIENRGTIKANAELINNKSGDAFANAFGIELPFMKDNSEVINSGTILANIKETSNSDSLSIGIFNGSSEYQGASADGKITNSGTVKATINDKLDNRGLSLWTYGNPSSNVKIYNEANGKLYGNIVLVDNATLNNKGFISLPYNSNKNAIVFDDEINGENVKIKFQANIPNLVNSGTIEIGAFKDSKGNIENTQIKTTNATFEEGSKMQVAVVSGSKAFNLNDTLAEVVKATNSLNGADNIKLNQTKLDDNSAILDFKLQYDEAKKQIDLVVAKVESIKDIVTKPDNENKPEMENKPNNNINVNAGNIGAVLDSFRNNQTMGNIISRIDSLASNQDVKKAVDSLVPTTATSLVNTASSINSSISNVVSTRLGNISSGINSGDEMSIGNNKLWAKMYGGLGKQSNKDGEKGFDLKTYGLGLGYDKEYKDGQVIGLGTFYTNAKVETNGVNHENKVDAYSLVAYGSNLLKDDKTTVYYQTSYSLQKNDSQRDLFTGERADAKFTSKTFAIESKIGHRIDINDKSSIEPNVGISYRHFRNPSYTESGSSANLKSEKFSNTELLGKVGAEYVYKITPDSKLTANLGAGYNFHDSKSNVTSSFEGASGVTFDSKGIDNGKWKYEAGVGYAMDINSKNNLGIDYKYVGEGKKFRNNILSVNYEYKF